jgi:hypothetical protein
MQVQGWSLGAKHRIVDDVAIFILLCHLDRSIFWKLSNLTMVKFQVFELSHILVSTSVTLVVYVVSLAFYRITLHPLAKIPGPKLAAITQLYQTYWGYRNGESRFYIQVERLHKQYGLSLLITRASSLLFLLQCICLNTDANYAPWFALHPTKSRSQIQPTTKKFTMLAVNMAKILTSTSRLALLDQSSRQLQARCIESDEQR